jgi:hypothetical protein
MVWEQLKGILGIKGKEGVRQDAFAKMGLYIINDDRLDQRTKLLEDLYQTANEISNIRLNLGESVSPEQCLEAVIERLSTLNQQIDHVATPYWRALSTDSGTALMRAWSMIHSYVLNWASSLLSWFQRIEKAKKENADDDVAKPTRSKEELVASLLEVVLMDYMPRALTLVKGSWTDKDVSPSWAGVIQPVMPASYGPTPVYDTGSIRQGEDQSKTGRVIRRPGFDKEG